MAQDYAEAVKWYRKAAEQGHADGPVQPRRHVANGQGVAQDYAEAVKWYRKAQSREPRSPVQPRPHVRQRPRRPQDYAEAVKWYRKAAEQGIADAQNNLGLMYDNGQAWRRTMPRR